MSQDSILGATAAEKLVFARVGEEIRLRFTVERDCYVTLVNVGTSGRIRVLFPNEHCPDGRVQGGRIYQTGTKGVMPFRIRSAGPPGRELVKAVATLEPLDLNALMAPSGNPDTASVAGAADRLVRGVAVATGASAHAETAPTDGVFLLTSDWATDEVIVETTESVTQTDRGHGTSAW